jgi:hypothetical protein
LIIIAQERNIGIERMYRKSEFIVLTSVERYRYRYRFGITGVFVVRQYWQFAPKSGTTDAATVGTTGSTGSGIKRVPIPIQKTQYQYQ